MSLSSTRNNFVITLLFLSLLSIASADRILVIFDNAQLKNTHSKLLNLLESPRNNKTIENSVEIAYTFGKEKIELKNYDRFLYDHIIVMCTSEKEMDSKIKIKEILNYFDQGGNVVIIGDVDTSVSFRKLFYSFGINLDEPASRVKDHFSNQNGKSDKVLTNNYEAGLSPFFPKTSQPLLFRGTGMQLVNYQNYQLYNLVKAEPTTFVKNEQTNQASRAGSEITFIAGVQGLNNARAILSSSLDFFSDEMLNQSKVGNKNAIGDLLNWVFGKSGKVRVNAMSYRGEGADNKEILFNVGEKIYFKADAQELDVSTQQWKPYITSDLQVEFVMLDPWVRVPLTLDNANTGTYQAEFYAPPKEGIYQFKITYKRPGFNFIKLAERATVRPYKHDEFERFLFVSYPYVFGLFSTIVGTFIFVMVYLYSSWAEDKSKQE